MTELKPVYTGSVNRWECDENDHLNVRFFAHKMYQTLQNGLVSAGLIDTVDLDKVGGLIRSAHMRYIAEARIAAPLTGYFGVVEQTSHHLQVVTQLRRTGTGELMTSYVIDLALESSQPLEVLAMPEGSGSRGLPMRLSSYASLDLETALGSGFMIIGQGVVQAEECNSQDRLQFYQYIGRVSDSIPNLWASLAGASSRGEGMLGGAVLEYRMDYLDSLGLGERFIVASGFRALAEKTKHLVHLVFNVDTGKCITASEAVAINMDLAARKAVPIPPAEREAMSKLLIEPPH